LILRRESHCWGVQFHIEFTGLKITKNTHISENKQYWARGMYLSTQDEIDRSLKKHGIRYLNVIYEKLNSIHIHRPTLDDIFDEIDTEEIQPKKKRRVCSG